MVDFKDVGTKRFGFQKSGTLKSALLILLILIACTLAHADGPGEKSGAKAGTPELMSLNTEDGSTLDALMARHYEDSMQVAFGTFTYEYTGLPSSFSRYLEEALASLIAKSDKYRLFNRNVAAAMDPIFREQYKDFFETNMVGGLLSGRFFDEGNRVRVRVELTNLRDGNLVGSGDLVKAKSELPPKLSIEPQKETQAMAASVVRLIPEEAPSANPVPTAASAALPVVKWAYQSSAGGLAVAVSTDRGTGASYQDGELMTVLVGVNKDAWVKVYHIDVHGTVQLIWPNSFGGAGMVRPGALLPIPSPGDPFEFLLGEPYGTEFIKVVASTEPWERTEADFSALGTDARAVVARGLTVKAPSAPATPAKTSSPARKTGERAEALASYYIGPRVTTVSE